MKKFNSNIISFLKKGRITKGQNGIPSLIHPRIVQNAVRSLIPASLLRTTAAVAERATMGPKSMLSQANPKDHHEPNPWSPGESFMLDWVRQAKDMKKLGYHLINDGNYGPVNKATTNLSKHINKYIPIYQLGDDEIDRSNLEVVRTLTRDVESGLLANKLKSGQGLMHAGNYPGVLYKDKNSDDYYVRFWDLNDYGQHDSKSVKQQKGKDILSYDEGGARYGTLQRLAEIYDYIGNPFVQRTAIRKLPEDAKELVTDILNGKYENYR